MNTKTVRWSLPLTTPVQPIEIIIGKLALLLRRTGTSLKPSFSSFVIARMGCLECLLSGNICKSSARRLFSFLVTYLAQGLLISVTTRKQQVAMQLAMMSGMLPSQLLSGFVFPIESMPTFFQYFTMIFPARWFMQISRDTFLKGTRASFSSWEGRF